MKTLQVDVWSDVACPWCYVGKRRLEAALAKFPQAAGVKLAWRAFELDPSAPAERDRSVSYAQRLAEKYRTPVPQAQQMIDRMVGVAKEDGLDFRFDIARGGNTFDAHRLLHFGKERGVQDAVKERLFRAYFTEGEPIGQRDTLVKVGVEAGLPEAEVRQVLESGKYADEVRADESLAQELGITGVPFFVLGGRYAISGAQPAEVLLAALTQAWEELAVEAPAPSEPLKTDGPVCGPDGC